MSSTTIDLLTHPMGIVVLTSGTDWCSWRDFCTGTTVVEKQEQAAIVNWGNGRCRSARLSYSLHRIKDWRTCAEPMAKSTGAENSTNLKESRRHNVKPRQSCSTTKISEADSWSPSAAGCPATRKACVCFPRAWRRAIVGDVHACSSAARRGGRVADALRRASK